MHFLRTSFLAFILLFPLFFLVESSAAADREARWADDASYHPVLSAHDEAFLAKIRDQVSSDPKTPPKNDLLEAAWKKSSLPKDPWGVSLVLYKPGARRIVVSRSKGSAIQDLEVAIERLRAHKRFSRFPIKDTGRVRLQVDLLLSKPRPVELKKLSMEALDSSRFEFGVDGLIASSGGHSRLFLPGDAFVKSILGFNQLEAYLRRELKVKERAPLSLTTFRSASFVSYNNGWLPLYRGYPIPASLTQANIRDAGLRGAQYLMERQRRNGKFPYYYDAASNSKVDHEHPERSAKNPYYNPLRHCSGLMTLLKVYEGKKDPKVLAHIRLGISYMMTTIRDYALDGGVKGSYVYDNRKAKLGSSGVLLHVLTEYRRLTGDEEYAGLSERLARHLVAQITQTGEFRYYKVYLDKEVPSEDNSKYFGFYYPGEAVTGLASYLSFGKPPAELRPFIVRKLKHAIAFLLKDRPFIYPKNFPSLPMDSWLLMGIRIGWNDKELQEADYRDFVFKEADTLLAQMYTVQNAPYPDYPGAFFYKLGDHPYPDGARGEGLMAAYSLAKLLKDEKRAERYRNGLKLLSRAMYLQVNTSESTYAAVAPHRAIGGIRFKLTRQWFRVDTIAHVANVFLDFAPSWGGADSIPK